MENPLSVRANAFAIASIMSDPNSTLDSDGVTMSSSSSGYEYASTGSSLASHHLHHQGPSDCRFQVDWSTMPQGNGYRSSSSSSTGLKAMEGQYHQIHYKHNL